MQERARYLNCKDIRDSCSTEELVFHCVPSADKIVEVCAPRYYVDEKYCVQFDEQIGRVVVDYRVPCQECPFQHYSNDSAKYTSCNKRIQALSNVQSMISTDVPSSKSTGLVQSTPESNIGLGSSGFGVLMVCVTLFIVLGVICISVAVGLNVGKGFGETVEMSMRNGYLDPHKGTMSYHALK
ncbi:uncharacterized protein LOC134232695 [Saccostrea cucullata]|uniref:uncharacterized protein LOC134232695 n=1 Tax=Saccostrea cuccullata TaxID=36930 RepID=UPI002ED656BB